MSCLFTYSKPNVTLVYNSDDGTDDAVEGGNITIHVNTSAPTTPVKSVLHHRRVGSEEYRLQWTKAMILMEAIEKNTKESVPRTSRLTMVYNGMAIMGVCIAMFFTLTMTYILWIGFYPPREVSSPFFIDRLYDFRDFLRGLQDGSIMQGFTDMLARSMAVTLNKEMEKYRTLNVTMDGVGNIGR